MTAKPTDKDKTLLEIKYQQQLGEFSIDIECIIDNPGITAIFGKSGAGKTSLLKWIAGLSSTDKRKAKTDNQLVLQQEMLMSGNNFVPAHKRQIAYIPQHPSLFQHLSVRDNLAYGLKRRKGSKKNIDAMIEMLEISSLIDKPIEKLSGGESQQIAIARALLSAPKLMLMDEALASIDLEKKEFLLQKIQTISKRQAIPILYVTHSVQEVFKISDHLLLLENGRLVSQGKPATLLAKFPLPLDPIQDIRSVFTGNIVSADTQWQLMKVSIGIDTIWIKSDDHQVGDSINVVFTARDISLTKNIDQATSVLNKLPCKVVSVDQDDSHPDCLVQLETLADKAEIIARITRKSASELQLTKGSDIVAQIKSVAVER